MQQEVLLAWLAALFGLMALALGVAAALVSPPVLLVALPLAGMAGLLWYHASGRLEERMRQQARRRRAREGQRGARGEAASATSGARPGRGGPFRGAPGFFGAGPRRRGRRRVAGDARRGASATRGRPEDTGMSRERALSVLDLDPGADEEAVRAAYRRRVKETHPDRDGDREAFQEVTEAYETLGGS